MVLTAGRRASLSTRRDRICAAAKLTVGNVLRRDQHAISSIRREGSTYEEEAPLHSGGEARR